MIELNKNKLIPANTTAWGDITGKIEDQQDLVSMLSSYATESWVSGQGYLKSVPSSYATKSWVSDQGYLTEHQPLKTINYQSLVGSGNINIEASVPDYYATKSWVSAQGYLTSETLPSDLATESWVEAQGYLTSIPEGYATQSWVESQGYLTSETLPSDLATESWVQSQGFATETWVSGQGYLTSVPEGYATENWVQLQGYISQVKTINSQSLVGTGNISLNTLTDSQMSGITPYLEPYSSITIVEGKKFNSSGEVTPAKTANKDDNIKFIFSVNDELYWVRTTETNGQIKKYKWDSHSSSSENFKIVYYNYYNTWYTDLYMCSLDEFGNSPVLLGDTYTDYTDPEAPVTKTCVWVLNIVDEDQPGMNTLTQEYVETQGLVWDGNLANIIKVNGHTYFVDTDNHTISRATYDQNDNFLGYLIDYNLTLSYGEGVGELITFYKYMFYYQNRCYFTNSGVLYTFDETYDGLGNVTGLQISISYDIPMDFVNDMSAAGGRMLERDGVLYAIGRYKVGQYVNGVWSDVQGFTYDRTPGAMKNYGARCRGVFFGFNVVGGNYAIATWNPAETIYHTQYVIDNDFASLDSRVSALESNYGDALIQTQNILS